MKDQYDGYVRTLEFKAVAALYHHHEADGDATSYGEFLAYTQVIADFKGWHVSTVRKKISQDWLAKVPA